MRLWRSPLAEGAACRAEPGRREYERPGSEPPSIRTFPKGEKPARNRPISRISRPSAPLRQRGQGDRAGQDAERAQLRADPAQSEPSSGRARAPHGSGHGVGTGAERAAGAHVRPGRRPEQKRRRDQAQGEPRRTTGPPEGTARARHRAGQAQGGPASGRARVPSEPGAPGGPRHRAQARSGAGRRPWPRPNPNPGTTPRARPRARRCRPS